MESHEGDLRAEVKSDALVRAIQDDFRKAALRPSDAQLLEFAVKLTLRPKEMTQQDVARLRTAGFDDPAILDAVHTIAYFNYANRVMDALGIEPEAEMRYPRTDPS